MSTLRGSGLKRGVFHRVAAKLWWAGACDPDPHSRTERNSPSASFILSPSAVGRCPVEGLRTSFPVTPLFSARAVVISTVGREFHRDSGRVAAPGWHSGCYAGCHPFDRLRAGSSDALLPHPLS